MSSHNHKEVRDALASLRDVSLHKLLEMKVSLVGGSIASRTHYTHTKPDILMKTIFKCGHVLIAISLFCTACSGATSEEDTPELPDAGVDMDTGVDMDAGVESDAGVMSDAGVANDAGVESDANVDMDAGVDPPQEDFSGVVINEIVSSGSPDWFELLNTGTTSVDLSGCTFSDDSSVPSQATIPQGTTLAPGAYLVFDVSDETVGFKLGGDEALYLYAPDGLEIDSVDWDEGDSPDGGSFARLPDGNGGFATTNVATREAVNVASIEEPCGNDVIDEDEACDTTTFEENATCEALGFASGDLLCTDSCTIDTTGCVANTTDVTLNEITSAGDDLIELYNSGNSQALIEGWFVADDSYPEDPESRYVFPAGALIESEGFLLLTKDMEHEFGVGKSDTITLYDADANVVDQIALPEDAAEVSYCRTVDGAGTWMICSAASFGTQNTP